MKNKLLSSLSNFEKFGTGICFERISLAYDLLKLRRYLYSAQITVITGTNGKGSTATALSNLLISAGKQTGLFTSPHFIEFNERFRHQGKPIDFSVLDAQLERLLPVVTQIETIQSQKFGKFEILFLLALCVFESLNIEYLVFEAGIGGRFDPVRTLQAPLCALTSVDLEHTQLLGGTLEAIAQDKIDATPPKGHCILGKLIPTVKQSSEADNDQLEKSLLIYAQASEFDTSCARDEVTITSIDKEQKTKQSCIRINMHNPLVPPFTIKVPPLTEIDILNWQTALALFKTLSKIIKQKDQNANLSIHPTIIENAFNHPSIAGRFETISHNPCIIVDAAHTPNAYQWLFNTIKTDYLDKPCIFVVGLSQGRDIQNFKNLIGPFDETIITTQAHNGIDAEQLAQALDTKHAYKDVANALDKAKQLALSQDGRIFVIGGLFLGAAVSACIKGLAYEQLNF